MWNNLIIALAFVPVFIVVMLIAMVIIKSGSQKKQDDDKIKTKCPCPKKKQFAGSEKDLGVKSTINKKRKK